MAALRQGQAWSQRLLWVLGLCLGLISPAEVCADIYGWVDERGVQNFVDDPTTIPDRFRGQARRMTVSNPPSATQTSRMSKSEPQPSREVERAPPHYTQGSVAVALAERLALAHPATPLQAVNALLERGILPPAGWMLDEPIDPGWMADLARSLLDATSAGRLLQTPEAALETLEGVAAERGIALVAFEAPPPPQPQVIVTQPAAVIVETVFVPAFPLHTHHLVHDPHFGKKFFRDHTHLEHRFPKNHGAGQHHPMDLRPRLPEAGRIAGFRLDGSHSIQSGSTGLTTGGSTGASMRGSAEPLTAGASTVLTTGGREKRSGTTRCASRSI
ncbi:MAG TPA: hypothetical protein VFM04_02245, partial [Candidatus Methylomirabilis sp.]|nr:hypothetical protein [Candidatus Methylomirabilis sp.]